MKHSKLWASQLPCSCEIIKTPSLDKDKYIKYNVVFYSPGNLIPTERATSSWGVGLIDTTRNFIGNKLNDKLQNYSLEESAFNGQRLD